MVTRYADDLGVGFENRVEGKRFLGAFRERLAKFGLELHAEKTRLIEFGRFAAQDRKQRGEASRKRSHSLALPISVGSVETALSSSGALRRRRRWWQSCAKLRRSVAIGCTSQWRRVANGFKE
jgi:hypothetical protein